MDVSAPFCGVSLKVVVAGDILAAREKDGIKDEIPNRKTVKNSVEESFSM